MQTVARQGQHRGNRSRSQGKPYGMTNRRRKTFTAQVHQLFQDGKARANAISAQKERHGDNFSQDLFDEVWAAAERNAAEIN